MLRNSILTLFIISLFIIYNCGSDNGGKTDVEHELDGGADLNQEIIDNVDIPPPECNSDSDCSDYIYCNGIEKCINGRCIKEPVICDDGKECTEDTCNETTKSCVFIPHNELCDDQNPCNGIERCEPSQAPHDDPSGCVAGTPIVCSDTDNNECTQEFCNPSTGRCEWKLKDSDGDSHGDINCTVCDQSGSNCIRGDDCDDNDPLTYPGAREICGDGKDNDCDRLLDYSDGCTVENDNCNGAIELTGTPSNPQFASLITARGTIETGCDNPQYPDVVFYFDLTQSKDLFIQFDSPGVTLYAAILTECGNPSTTLYCTSGIDFELRVRGLEPGRYYLVVSGERETNFYLSITTRDPAPRPEGDICTTAPNISGNGTFSATTREAEHDYQLSCGNNQWRDVTYQFTLTQPRSIQLTVNTENNSPIAVALQRQCGVISTQRFCVYNNTIQLNINQLDPGTYYLIFQHPDEINFSFSLSFGDPVPSPLLPILPTTQRLNSPTSGSSDDGQYNIDIAPLSFPFNGSSYTKIAVSTNGYIRFGTTTFPSATGFSSTETEIDSAFQNNRAQISFLAEDGKIESPGYVAYNIDTTSNRVVIDIRGYHDLSHSNSVNDIQIILFCDTGNIQISYINCDFVLDSSDNWGIGISEPNIPNGQLQPHDFVNHVSGDTLNFSPGAIYQFPKYNSTSQYAPLNGRAILFIKTRSGWQVFVDQIPL